LVRSRAGEGDWTFLTCSGGAAGLEKKGKKFHLAFEAKKGGN